MKHFSRFFLIGTAILFLAFFLASPALAMEFRSSENAVVVSQDEMIAGSLFAGGSSVQIDGAVEGDLFCAGQTITIKGSVGGDVLCSGQTIRIEGTVGGNIRSIGQAINVEGAVERNVMMLGQNITLGEESTVGGEAVVAGQNVMVTGDVTESFLGAGNSVDIEGSVGGDATLYGNMVQVGSGAHIGGKLTYASEKDITVAEDAMVGEIVRKAMPEKSSLERSKKPLPIWAKFMKGKPWPQNAVGSILTYIVIGAIGILLFKNGISKIVDVMKEHAGASFGVGLLWYIVFPVLFILFLITIIGIPIALLYAFLFAIVALISKLLVAILIGKEMTVSFWKAQKDNWYIAMIIGVTVSWLVYSMPYIGGLTSCAAILWGTGGLVKTIFFKKQTKSVGR
jgi:hypothetical protein